MVAVIRPLGRPGDLGWVVMAHGEIYAREFGWDLSFEALVSRIVTDWSERNGPAPAIEGRGPDRAAVAGEGGGSAAEVLAGDSGGPDRVAFASRRGGLAREAAWIAELDGRRVGCVFCVAGDQPGTAKLRILLVDPVARGHGLGARLVGECVAFARAAGYDRIVLWTNDVLVAARRIYQAAGFVQEDEYAHRSFGADLTAQTWSLPLTRR